MDAPLRSIGLRLVAAFLTAIVAAGLRIAGHELPLGEVLFFRSAIAAIAIAAVYYWRGQFRAAFYTSRPLGHFIRCISGTISTAAYIGALTRLPLVSVMVLVYSTPIITVVLAAWVLKEKVHVYRWSATFVGFIGIVMMLLPYLGHPLTLANVAGLGVMLGLLSTVSSAISAIQIRRLTETEKTPAIVFYFYLFCSVVAALTLPFWWSTPTAAQWALLILVGLLSAVSQLVMTDSLRHAGASVAVFFDYTIILWSFLLGYFAFHELPDTMVYLGGSLILTSGLFIIYREQQLKKARAAFRV